MLHVRQAPRSLADGNAQGAGQVAGGVRAFLQGPGRSAGSGGKSELIRADRPLTPARWQDQHVRRCFFAFADPGKDRDDALPAPAALHFMGFAFDFCHA